MCQMLRSTGCCNGILVGAPTLFWVVAPRFLWRVGFQLTFPVTAKMKCRVGKGNEFCEWCSLRKEHTWKSRKREKKGGWEPGGVGGANRNPRVQQDEGEPSWKEELCYQSQEGVSFSVLENFIHTWDGFDTPPHLLPSSFSPSSS